MENKIIERMERIAEKYAELTEMILDAAIKNGEVDGKTMAEINDGIRMIAYAATTVQRVRESFKN